MKYSIISSRLILQSLQATNKKREIFTVPWANGHLIDRIDIMINPLVLVQIIELAEVREIASDDLKLFLGNVAIAISVEILEHRL